MTQVSRIPLRKEIETRIFEIFLISLEKINNRAKIETFIDDLLSPVEKVMLSKRLSIAYLLSKGYKQRSICQILKVSLSTVNRISLRMQLSKGEGYNTIIKEIINKEKSDEFWKKLDLAIGDFVPPKGRNWRSYRREQWEKRVNLQKPF